MRRPAPHLVIDARMIHDGGIGTYLRHLIPGLRQRAAHWRFSFLGDSRALASCADPAEVVQTTAPIYSIREQAELAVRLPAADLLWCPHYNIPVVRRGPRLVVTVHDVCHLALPELFGGFLHRTYARALYGEVRRRASAVLFDSEFSRAEMARLVGAPKGASAVVHLGVESGGTEAPGERPVAEPYFIYVGNFKRHKNVPTLVRAFARAQQSIPHRLVLVGRREGLRADPEIGAVLQRHGERVIVAGEVAAPELRRYLHHADALVTVSRYEGFGLPPLEAMAAGVPTLVSRCGSLPEICGDAALYCDSADEADIAQRMVELATSPALRQELVTRGLARARRFTWDAAADGTFAMLVAALG